MTQWLSIDFKEKYKYWLRANNYSFHLDLNKYFYDCFQLYQKTNDTSYLYQGTKIFDLVKGSCFINPHIFHNVACIYAAIGEKDKAMQCVEEAYIFSYEEIRLIWEDEDRQILFDEPVFRYLRENYNANLQNAFSPDYHVFLSGRTYLRNSRTWYFDLALDLRPLEKIAMLSHVREQLEASDSYNIFNGVFFDLDVEM
jgi:tetratricopeptide (TPR) repeat protein